MKPRLFCLKVFFLTVLVAWAASQPRGARAGDDLVDTVSGLLSDKDKEVRALGLEQVRDEVKGAEATRRFAALLPRLSPEARAALLGALGERGDAAARPAVLDQIECAEPEVRSAAIRALGDLGDQGDVPVLTRLVAGKKTEKDAAAAITRLRGEGVNRALWAEAEQRRRAFVSRCSTFWSSGTPSTRCRPSCKPPQARTRQCEPRPGRPSANWQVRKTSPIWLAWSSRRKTRRHAKKRRGQ